MDIIGGHKKNLKQEDQWPGSLYRLNVNLRCYDFCHRLTAKSHTALKLLHLSQIEYLRFAACIAAGEYIPCEHPARHKDLQSAQYAGLA